MLLIVVGRAFQFFLLFATIKIATTLLAPAEMAKIYIIASLFSFLAMVLINPVGMFINRRLHSWNSTGQIQNYLKYFWAYLLLICLVTLLTFEFLISVKIFKAYTETRWISILVVGTLLFTTTNQSVIPALNLLGYRGWFIALTLATTAVSLAASVLIVELYEPRAEYWQCGLLVGQLLVGAVGWRVLYNRLNTRSSAPRLTKLHANTLAKFALPIAVAAVLGWFQTQSYRFMMEAHLGLLALGLFGAGYGICAGLISAFESVLATYLQPVFYKQVSNGNLNEQSKAWGEYVAVIFPSLMLVGLAIYATAPELTRVMLGPEYGSSSKFIGWGVIAELARVASAAYGMIAHARMKTRLLVVPNLVGASLSVALIWWLMPIYGPNGVGAALVVSSVIAFILTYAATRNELATMLPHRRLARSICMGGGIVLFTAIFRQLTGEQESLKISLIELFLVGMIFVLFQYSLLRPLLHGSHGNESSTDTK